MTNIPRIKGFEDFGSHVWLDTAHQGALPINAAQDAYEAVKWKAFPFALTQQRFKEVPNRLRRALGRLIGAADDQIILANSTSYGLHLIAHSYPWCQGDEVIVADNDFPADILPWLLCERRYGIKVVRIHPSQRVLSVSDLKSAITLRTRLLCTTWVHSFSGCATDITALGNVCREKNITFVVNGSQAIGARSFALDKFPVDALVSAGHKWLCGPYGTGFCWVAPTLIQRLTLIKAYWLTLQTADDLGRRQTSPDLPTTKTARVFDVFGTANFFNFKPWATAIELLLEIGIEHIAKHDQDLVEQFLAKLNKQRYQVLSPHEGSPERSTLILISHNDCSNNPAIVEKLSRHNIHVSLRTGALRISPHLYNSSDDIDQILSILNSA